TTSQLGQKLFQHRGPRVLQGGTMRTDSQWSAALGSWEAHAGKRVKKAQGSREPHVGKRVKKAQ
ncbi:hypothetical protein NDU88_004120, partial [Pleurodeles waltl]